MKQEKTGRKILVRPRNSLALTSLSWESLKGALPVSLKTISTFSKLRHNLAISKGCWHIFNAAKVMMSWDNKLCNYFRCVQRSVYATRYWFLFHKNFKSYTVYSMVHQVTFYQPNETSFLLHPADRPVAASRSETFWFWLRINNRERGRKRGKFRTFGKVVLL